MLLARRMLIPCVTAVIALFAGTRLAAEEFRSEASRFRVQLPDNWVRFAPLKLTLIKNANVNQPNSIIHEGYERRNQPFNADGLPFILIQEARGQKTGFETYDQFERLLHS